MDGLHHEEAMFDASHDAGCQETSLGRHKRPSRKGTTPQHTHEGAGNNLSAINPTETQYIFR